jgi:hypothetical protein
MAVRLIVLLGCTMAVLNGCALLYFPLLLFVPLQPIIMMAAKIAARYGPILLMLLVEADPQQTGMPETMIAVHPAHITPQTQLDDLESRLLYEVAHEPNLVSVAMVDIETMTEEWLRQQLADAAHRGCTVRLVFVDSRKFKQGRQLSENTRITLADAGIPVLTSGNLARRVAGNCGKPLDPGMPGNRQSDDAAYAMLAGAVFPELE